MVPWPRKCPGVVLKVCGRFLPAKDHDPHRLCVTCRGKSCNVDDQCVECHEWSEERCREVAAYAVKLSAQREKKKERKAKSSSSVFFANYASAIESTCLYLGGDIDIGVINSRVCGDVCCCWACCFCCSINVGCCCGGTVAEAEKGDGSCTLMWENFQDW